MEKLLLLKENAKKVADNAYAPYSKFKVGAALLDRNGKAFSGCNVENLAFPSGICAERAAVFKAVSEVGPSMQIDTLVIYTPTLQVTTPCGGCRQVIQEFAGPETRIISFCDGEEQLDVRFVDLFPLPTLIDGLKN